MLCGARAAYWEARDQPKEAQKGVVHVVMNLAAFRGVSACDVVNSPRWNGPEFRKLLIYGKIREKEAWEIAQWVAMEAFRNPSNDPTNGAVSFHDTTVHPEWGDRQFTLRIGKLLFYKPK